MDAAAATTTSADATGPHSPAASHARRTDAREDDTSGVPLLHNLPKQRRIAPLAPPKRPPTTPKTTGPRSRHMASSSLLLEPPSAVECPRRWDRWGPIIAQLTEAEKNRASRAAETATNNDAPFQACNVVVSFTRTAVGGRETLKTKNGGEGHREGASVEHLTGSVGNEGHPGWGGLYAQNMAFCHEVWQQAEYGQDAAMHWVARAEPSIDDDQGTHVESDEQCAKIFENIKKFDTESTLLDISVRPAKLTTTVISSSAKAHQDEPDEQCAKIFENIKKFDTESALLDIPVPPAKIPEGPRKLERRRLFYSKRIR
ncbi:hypothetical protein BDV96DRAFT_650499 [Lophiotrema nucula]|uniref:Uncharacterized protein n=1 Tax=Lophiotrema nucula TaxID=690887 RepID=A0A6A5YUS2_9PLEO|nr:hypothetical protein BDV96DRAFT_650499 [Lophiotrema nucula]